jgi:hypothetical protein
MEPTLLMFLYSGGGLTRTNDLQVMSLASYQLLHSAIFSRLRLQKYNFKFDFAREVVLKIPFSLFATLFI